MSLTPEQIRILDEACQGEGRTRSDLIGRLIAHTWAGDPVLRNTTAGGVGPSTNQTVETAGGLRPPVTYAEHEHKYTAGSSGVLACGICGKLKS